ncbi:MAG: Ig-like domain-containing protein [Gemmatimonadaceae bacterium]|nr:Ig-like domain-containing protein [Gemmatimonadaceae bacterium]
MRVVAHNVLSAARRSTYRTGAALLLLGGLAGCLDLKTTADACSVTVAPATLTLPVNGTSTIVGTAFDCKGNSIKNKTITFSTSNPAVATVTTGGNVLAVAVGSATISAVAQGKSAAVQVTVTPEQAASVTLTPATITLRRGNARQLTAVAKNAQQVVIAGRTFRWASSNSSIVSVDQNGNVTALSTGTAVVSAEADQQTGSATITVTEVPIGSCSLSPASQKLTVTASTQPTLVLRDTANNVIPSLNRQMNWSSSNQVSALVSQTGLVTAVKAGTATITAASVEYPAVSCTATVETVDARIVSAVISPRPSTLRLSIPRQFSVTLSDSVGGAIPPGRVVNWTSVTPSVATVSATGLVTGLQLGNARIAVNAEGAVDTVSFTITKVPVATIQLSPSSSSVVQGQTRQLTATLTDSTGATVTDRTIEWTSSDPTRATVSGTGLVTTLAPGTVTITATSETRSGTASVTVQQIPVDTIVVNGTYSAALSDANKSFAITLRDASGNTLFNRSVSVTSSDPSVATGTANGQGTIVTVSASKAGSATFTLRALNSNSQPEGKASTVVITINPSVTPLRSGVSAPPSTAPSGAAIKKN